MANPESDNVIDVMVCLATVTPPRLVSVRVAAQATLADAVRASGLLDGVGLTIEPPSRGSRSSHSFPRQSFSARQKASCMSSENTICTP